MKQKHTFFVTVGIPSLFLIFSVLCLCVLALLTLGSSRSSLNTARHSMKQTENYYTGCADATETVSEIRDDLEQYREKASDETGYFHGTKACGHKGRSQLGFPQPHPFLLRWNFRDTTAFCSA